MTRTPFLAANFKMFKTVHEAVAYAKEFRALVKNLDDYVENFDKYVPQAPDSN